MVRSQTLKNYTPFALVAGAFLFLGIFLGPLQFLDDGITNVIYNLPSSWKPIMEAISFLGSTDAIVGIVLIWCVINLLLRRKDRAVVLLSSLLVVPLYGVLKSIFHRERPVGSPTIQFGFQGDSFPSGHSAASCAVYLTIAYLLYKHLPRPWRGVFLWAAIILVVLIGISRIYLHAHHPTDVFGGWLVAGLGLLMVREITNYFEGTQGSSTTK